MLKVVLKERGSKEVFTTFYLPIPMNRKSTKLVGKYCGRILGLDVCMSNTHIIRNLKNRIKKFL